MSRQNESAPKGAPETLAKGSANRVPRQGGAPLAAIACPDCSAPLVEYRPVHKKNCPLLCELQQTIKDDQAWFRSNGKRAERHRATTPAERTELRIHANVPERYVIVSRLPPGAHLRVFLPSTRFDLIEVPE